MEVWERTRRYILVTGGYTCSVAYDPGNGKYQNVHASREWNDSREATQWREQVKTEYEELKKSAGKRWTRNDEADKIEERKTSGLELSKDLPEERSLKAEWRLSASNTSGSERPEAVYLGKISSSDRQELIVYLNEEIRNQGKENAIVVTKDGEVYHFSSGKSDYVWIEGIELEGADVLHNHPRSNGILSFGEDDFDFLKENQNIASPRCCNAEYDYVTWVEKPIDDVVYGNVYTQILERAKELYKMGVDYDTQDLVMQKLSDMGYLHYEKHKVDR